MKPLIQVGDFRLNSGVSSDWHINVEAFDRNTLHALARISSPLVTPFGGVIGVPSGGLAFAEMLRPFATPGNRTTLVVDDVWTTGASMRGMVKEWNWESYKGLVIFARGPLQPWCTSIFSANPRIGLTIP